MHDDENHTEVSANPLNRISPVVLIRIAMNVGPSGECEIHAEHRMEHDGQEQQSPLQKNQGWQIVDEVDFVLEGFDPSVTVVWLVEPIAPNDRQIGSQVQQQKGADGEDTRQRVQSPQQEVVSIDEAGVAVGHGAVPNAQERLRRSSRYQPMITFSAVLRKSIRKAAAVGLVRRGYDRRFLGFPSLD